MGGEIGVESTVGQGSTFWVKLPMAAGPEAREDSAETKPQAEGNGGESYTVLYIDDNVVNLTLPQRILDSRWELKFLTATNGVQGLALAREHHPDLILLDLYLPDLSGDEVLLELRGDSETASIPVFILSADVTAGQAERLLSAGAQACLTKPFDIQKLLQAVESSLTHDSHGRNIRPAARLAPRKTL